MAIRKIIHEGDEILGKKSKKVTEFNDRLHSLLDDMADTLEESGGVGLAAVQISVLRRIFLVLETNVDEDEPEILLECINPEIIEVEGEQVGPEGCLSVPGKFGIVTRPEKVKIRAQDRDGDYFEYEGFGLTARAFCHESEHLEGKLFLEKVERMLDPDEISSEEGEED